VIATGFDMARPSQEGETLREERVKEPVRLIDDLDIPAFLRRR
jgi:hypothetical protein